MLCKSIGKTMTTEKQLTANKQNASLSTGAITNEGKAIVAKNAIKHGIFAKSFIVEHKEYEEKFSDYQELLDSLISGFDPKNQIEYLLVEKIAIAYWRMRRVSYFETQEICKKLDIPYIPFFANDTFDKLIRYESHLQKLILQNIVMLKKMQSMEG